MTTRAEPKPPLDVAANGEKKTLAQKILEIQDRVGVVKKQGKFGSEMGGGNFLRIEDAVVAVNKLLTANKLILHGTLMSSNRVPHEKAGKVAGEVQRSGYISSVTMCWMVEDTETGEQRTWIFPGDGYDSTDKSVYKAMTGCRKYAIINIFNLPIGNDVEEMGMAATAPSGRQRQEAVVKKTLAGKANSDNPEVRKLAVDALSQIEPEKKILVERPEELQGHYIRVKGLIAVPQLEQYFLDTDSKRFQSKADKSVYWRVPANYERGLVELCAKLQIEVEG